MRITKVPFAEVAADLARPQPINFNTSFHSRDEAPDLDDDDDDVNEPSEAPYSFKRWLPLILRSRGLSRADVQVVSLSRPQAQLLLEAMEASAQLDHVNRLYREDLDDVVAAPALSGIVFPPGGLFARLDACSPKDGAQTRPGERAIRSVDDLLLRLVTSGRARSAVRKILQEDGGGGGVQLYLLPFDARMSSAREYRVFCPPPGGGGGAEEQAHHRISAISQYQWHKPWLFAERGAAEQQEAARAIWEGCRAVHAMIVADLSAHGDDDNHDMDLLLRRQGFSFDVLYDDAAVGGGGGGRCELVELNGFGARSSCGSCLFQWVRDREVLYSRTGTTFKVTW